MCIDNCISFKKFVLFIIRYFEGGYSSVYFWDIDDGSFASCWLVQKDVEGVRGLNSGFWNSIHVLEATQIKENKFEYKLTTTVIVCR